MNTNKDSVVKQSGNDAEGCRSQKILFQPNMRVFLQYSVKFHQILLELFIIFIQIIFPCYKYSDGSAILNQLNNTEKEVNSEVIKFKRGPKKKL